MDKKAVIAIVAGVVTLAAGGTTIGIKKHFAKKSKKDIIIVENYEVY